MNQKSIIAILAVVVIILFGATVCFATINQNSQSSIVTTPKITQNGWLTYKNLGFEISYPNAWIVDKSSETQGVVWLRTKSRQADLDVNKMTRIFDIEIRTYATVAELPNNKQDKLSFANWISKKATEYGFVELTPIVVDGVNGYKGVGDGETYGNYLQFVENKGKVYQINIEGKATEEKMNIVKSFKFAQSDWAKQNIDSKNNNQAKIIRQDSNNQNIQENPKQNPEKFYYKELLITITLITIISLFIWRLKKKKT